MYKDEMYTLAIYWYSAGCNIENETNIIFERELTRGGQSNSVRFYDVIENRFRIAYEDLILRFKKSIFRRFCRIFNPSKFGFALARARTSDSHAVAR